MVESESRLLDMMNSSNKGKVKEKEERVLKYLLEHEDEIQSLSIADIAEKADVSKATVVRFCKSLNFTGLKDFKVWYEAGKSASYGPVVAVNGTESEEEALSLLKDGSIKTIEKTLSGKNIEIISSIAQNIKKYERIALLGEENGPFPTMLKNKINRAFPEKEVITNTDNCDSVPYAIVFSLEGNDRKAMTALSSIILDGGLVDAITAKEDSLIAKASSKALVVSDENFLKKDGHLLGEFSLYMVVNYIDVILSL